jgi:hypothetical protein
MKQIIQFLQDELSKLSKEQQASLRGMLFDVYNSELTMELEPSFNLDDKSEADQFVAGEHRNQGLIMERIIGILNDDTMQLLSIEKLPDLLAAHCKLYESSAKLFMNPELEELPEDRLNEAVTKEMDRLLALFPGITTKDELRALMRSQKKEKEKNFEVFAARIMGGEMPPKKMN